MTILKFKKDGDRYFINVAKYTKVIIERNSEGIWTATNAQGEIMGTPTRYRHDLFEELEKIEGVEYE